MEKLVILCVDDERIVLDALQSQLYSVLGENYDYEIANSGEEAIDVVEGLLGTGQDIAVVISDQMMPGMKGNELLIKLNGMIPRAKKILLTGQASADAVGRALNEANLYRYITKPWDTIDLMMTIEEAIKSYLMGFEINEQKRILESLYNSSNILGKIRNRADLMKEIANIIINEIGIIKIGILTFGENHVIKEKWVWDVRKDGGELFLVASDGIISERAMDMIKNNGKVSVSNCNIQPWGSDSYIKIRNIKSLWGIKFSSNLGEYGFYFEGNSYSAFVKRVEDYMNLFINMVMVKLESVEVYEYLEEKINERTKLLDDKNKDMKDSIVYASRLQTALFPSVNNFYEFFGDSKIYLQPKDIVSGDFYWYKIIGNKIHLCLADCTGHGVPGALLSVMGINLLNEVVMDEDLPSNILNKMHRLMIKKLRMNHDNLDGMDIIYLIYDKLTKELVYASGGRPLLWLNGDMHEIKGDKNGIGGHTPLEYEFKCEQLKLSVGDLIFIYSDGYSDQFGGVDNKKIGNKTLKEIIILNRDKRVEEIINGLMNKWDMWIGKEDQTDDLSIIGFRVE